MPIFSHGTDRVVTFVEKIMPAFRSRVILFDKPQPLFSAYHLDSQVEEATRPEVTLPSGGSIVINTTEARKGVIADSRLIRVSALQARVPYYTTIAGARAACMGLASMRELIPYDLHGLHAELVKRPATRGSPNAAEVH